MATRFNRAQFESQLRAAQRKAENDFRAAQRRAQAEVDRINRENQRRVDEYNRKARQHNANVVASANRQIDAHNREIARVNAHNTQVNASNARADAQNRSTVAALNSRLRSASGGSPRYTPGEQALADRVHEQATRFPDREWDAFLSYARIDGAEVAVQLRNALTELGVSVWFDEIAITPGKSQALQMDQGLRTARCGVALLTPAYLTGRFWTERELGALLGKSTLIPVLHNVTFEEVAEYSGILPDLAGFETRRDSVEVIAEKIAAAVLPVDA